jgi:hypothetical protein
MLVGKIQMLEGLFSTHWLFGQKTLMKLNWHLFAKHKMPVDFCSLQNVGVIDP